jgi:flagellar P-ring protein precursor FlgI
MPLAPRPDALPAAPRLRRRAPTAALALAAVALLATPAGAQRVRDVARVKGIRPQHLTGIGLVIGLAGTGDSQQSELKKKFFANLIRNMGTNLSLTAADLKSRNTALVIVSATVPSTLKVGAEFDVTVSSLGDAPSLRGGHLLAVPLRGPSAVEVEVGKTSIPYYALAQGDVFVEREGDGKATVGRSQAVLEAALDEGPLPATLDSISVLLLEPDFGTAARIAGRINRHELFREAEGAGGPLAAAVDSGTVRVRIPNHFLREDRVVDFISRVLDIEVPQVEGDALISINRHTGAVVINGAVRVAASALVTYKGAMVRIPEAPLPPLAAAPGAAERPPERNPLLIDVVEELRKQEFDSRDIANILRELHRTRAILGRVLEW